MPEIPVLEDRDLPPIFHAADTSSVVAQKRLITAVTIRLIGIVAAGMFGLATWKAGKAPTDWAGVIAALCFFSAVIDVHAGWIKASVISLHPESPSRVAAIC